MGELERKNTLQLCKASVPVQPEVVQERLHQSEAFSGIEWVGMF